MSIPAIRREAALDVGSNSVRLLVADVSREDIVPVYQQKITCRLIAGMTGGMLSSEAIDRARRAIRTLADEARERGAEYVYAFGTSAMRDGENSSLVMDDARAYGVRFSILSGEEEARLAYEGAAPEGRVGVIDIGGGSTEYMKGENGRVLRACSAPIGAVRLGDMTARTSDMEKMLGNAEEALRPSADKLEGVMADRWIGEGGTITTLAAIKMKLPEYDEAKIEGFPIERTWLEETLPGLCVMTTEERTKIPGIEKRRADIIHYGAAILLCSMRLMQIERVYASAHDNLTGYMKTVVRKDLFGA